MEGLQRWMGFRGGGTSEVEGHASTPEWASCRQVRVRVRVGDEVRVRVRVRDPGTPAFLLAWDPSGE